MNSIAHRVAMAYTMNDNDTHAISGSIVSDTEKRSLNYLLIEVLKLEAPYCLTVIKW